MTGCPGTPLGVVGQRWGQSVLGDKTFPVPSRATSSWLCGAAQSASDPAAWVVFPAEAVPAACHSEERGSGLLPPLSVGTWAPAELEGNVM